MASWSSFVDEAPDLAARIQARFEATGLAFLATVRRDGWPRISGIEPLIAVGELWLGMMEGSRKAADVGRDPRLALHAASVDKNVGEGDAKLTGRAVPATEEEFARYHAAASGAGEVPPGPFPLFRVDLTEASLLSVAPTGDHLVIEWWKPGAGVNRVERR